MARKMGGILGLDVGTKKVGIAFSDPHNRYAIPHKTVIRAGGKAENEILKLIAARSVDLVVAGLPLGRGGERNDQCLKVENFCRRLQKRAQFDIAFVDEHLSSEEAKDKLGSIGKRARLRGDIDAVAASIILQSYLDSKTGAAS
jgi:putative Holliday junction resolvase